MFSRDKIANWIAQAIDYHQPVAGSPTNIETLRYFVRRSWALYCTLGGAGSLATLYLLGWESPAFCACSVAIIFGGAAVASTHAYARALAASLDNLQKAESVALRLVPNRHTPVQGSR